MIMISSNELDEIKVYTMIHQLKFTAQLRKIHNYQIISITSLCIKSCRDYYCRRDASLKLSIGGPSRIYI